MTFLAAALLQWVNPKAWVLALAAATAYTTSDAQMMPQVLILGGVFTLIGLPTSLL